MNLDNFYESPRTSLSAKSPITAAPGRPRTFVLAVATVDLLASLAVLGIFGLYAYKIATVRLDPIGWSLLLTMAIRLATALAATVADAGILLQRRWAMRAGYLALVLVATGLLWYVGKVAVAMYDGTFDRGATDAVGLAPVQVAWFILYVLALRSYATCFPRKKKRHPSGNVTPQSPPSLGA